MDRDTLLKILAEVESTSGKDPRSRLPASSLDQAIGKYQIKPSQIESLPNLMRNTGLVASPETKELSKYDYSDISEMLRTNPELEEKVAQDQADLVLARGQDDLLKSAFLHHMGASKLIPKPNAELGKSTVSEMAKKTRDKRYLQKILNAYEQLPESEERIVDPEKFNRPKLNLGESFYGTKSLLRNKRSQNKK